MENELWLSIESISTNQSFDKLDDKMINFFEVMKKKSISPK